MSAAGDWCRDNMADLRLDNIRRVIAGVSKHSASKLALAGVGATMVVAGMGGQVITLNKWLKNFPAMAPNGEAVGGPYTVLLCTSILVFFKFLIGYVGWVVYKRPSMAFALQLRTWKWLVVTGFLSAMNGLLVVYATNNTPEVIQAILVSSQILFTLFFSAVCKLNNGRSYCHILVIGSVLLCCGGIALGMANGMSGQNFTKETAAWAALFLGGIIPAAATNVTTALFFRQVIAQDEHKAAEDDIAEGQPVIIGSSISDLNDQYTGALVGHTQGRSNLSTGGAQSDLESGHVREASFTPLLQKSNGALMKPDGQLLTDGTTAKLFFLTIVTLFMFLFTLAMFPMDWAPFFGMYAGHSQVSVTALRNGFMCVANRIDGCDKCLIFFFAFAICYAFSNAGNAIVNRFSAPLAALLSQVSAPLAAVLIVVFPTLNANPGTGNNSLGPNVGAVVLIVIGAIMFTLWEQLSSLKQSGGLKDDAVDDYDANESVRASSRY